MPNEQVYLELDSSQYEAAMRRAEAVTERYAEVAVEAQRGNKEIEKAFMRTLTAADRTALTLGKLNMVTNQNGRATIAYQQTVDALTRSIIAQETGSKRFTAAMDAMAETAKSAKKAQEDLAKGFGESKKRADALETALSALRIPGADLVQQYKQMQDAAQNAAEVGGQEEVSLLKRRVAYAAVAAAVIGLGAGLVSAAVKAAEWNKELKDVGLQLDAQSTKNLADNKSALDATAASTKALAVSMVDTFSPGIERVSRGLSVMALRLRDAFQGRQKDLSEYQAQVTELGNKLQRAEEQARALARAQELQAELGKRLTDIGKAEDAFIAKLTTSIQAEKASRLDGIAAIEAERDIRLTALKAERDALVKDGASAALISSEYEQMRREIIRTAEHEIRKERAETARQAVEEEKKVSEERAETARQAVEKEKKASEERARHIKEVADFKASVSEETRNEYAAALALEYQLTQAIAEEEEKRTKKAQEEAEKKKAIKRGELSTLKGFYDNIGSLAGSVSEMIIMGYGKQSDAAESAAIAAFRIQQATGAVSVVISTAQAIMSAMTLPPPASYVAAAAAAATGAVQLATILTQSPPSQSGASATAPTAPTAPSMGTTSTASTSATRMAVASGGEATAGPSYRTASADMVVTEVSDARVPASSGSMLLKTTPGDTVDVYRGGLGAEGRGRPVVDAVGRVERAVDGLRADIQALTDALMYRAARAEAGGPIRRS